MKVTELRLYTGVKIDENNVVKLAPADLLTSLNTYIVKTYTNLSLVLDNFTLRIPENYFTIMQVNYMAFRENTNTRWFFARVEKLEYISDSVTEVKFTIDYWQTYYSEISLLPCFVEREITATDVIGEHTLDEGLDVGRVECLATETISELQNTTFYIGAFCGYDPDSDTIYQRRYIANRQIFAYGLVLFKIQIAEDFDNFFEYVKLLNESTNGPTIEDLHDVFIVPAGMIDDETLVKHGFNDAQMNDYEYDTGGIKPMLVEEINKEVTKLYSVTGKYQPSNNKCYCYPYNYLLVDNYAGNNKLLKYEQFSTENCKFRIELALSIGISARCVPQQYADLGLNYPNQIPMAKLPTCSWSADSYVNWLTQNALNVQSQILGLGEKAVSTFSTYAGGLLLEAQGLIPEDTHQGLQAGGLIQDAMNLIGTFKKAEMLPDTQNGSNLGDVNFSSFTSGFEFKKMRCTDENLRVIDNYFTKFGYKINRLKTPNITTSRFNHFYVKTGQGEKAVSGNIPKDGLDILNKQFSNGITIWKSLIGIGNYS